MRLLSRSYNPEMHMNHSLYEYSLAVALSLMSFFGFYFLLARTPDKATFSNYLRSRRIMGVALLLLAANYAVHLFFEIRFRNLNAAILMNLSTYFLCYWLFSSALTTLLDRFYITRRRLGFHLAAWVLFTLLAGAILLCLPSCPAQRIGLAVMAAWLGGYGLWLSCRLLRAYRCAVRLFADTHSDDIAAYLRWLSIFTYGAILFGVGCSLLTFLPDRYVFLWVLSSIPFYIYLYCSYLNYLLFYERVERALEEELPPSGPDTACVTSDSATDVPDHETQLGYADLSERLAEWMAADGYLHSGLTVRELSEVLHTNRTYLSGYIRSRYHLSFRDWIAGLRLEYAKRCMLSHPEQNIAEVAEVSGFVSPSHFTRLFKEKEGIAPSQWRKAQHGGGPVL